MEPKNFEQEFPIGTRVRRTRGPVDEGVVSGHAARLVEGGRSESGIMVKLADGRLTAWSYGDFEKITDPEA